MRSDSSGCGSFTLQTSSARSQTSAAVGTISAPAAAYSASAIAEFAPAPLSTSTSTPCWDSSRTPSGVIATRCSLFLTSRGNADDESHAGHSCALC